MQLIFFLKLVKDRAGAYLMVESFPSIPKDPVEHISENLFWT